MKTVIGFMIMLRPNAPAMNEDQALAAGVITQSGMMPFQQILQAAIQGISGYVGTMSDIDISDDAAALISAGDAVHM